MILIIENVPNIMSPQNLVNSLIPESSKLSRSIRPNAAQNKVCVVSHKLKKMKIFCKKRIFTHTSYLLCKFPICQTVVYFNHNFSITSLICNLDQLFSALVRINIGKYLTTLTTSNLKHGLGRAILHIFQTLLFL